LIPGRPPGEAVNAFSALWGALGAGLIALSVMLLLTPGYRFMARALPRPFPALKNACLVSGALAGLLAGLSYSIWFQAITAEAYALNGFFSALIFYLLLLLGAEGPLGRNPTARQHRLVLLVFVAYGLSCGNHPVTIVFVPMFLYLIWKQRETLRNSGLVVMVILAYGLSGLLPYLYLPWAASAYPNTLWNDVTSVKGFIAHLTGSQWTGTEQSYGWSHERLTVSPSMVFRELFAMGLLALCLGLWRLWKEQREWFALLLVFMVPAWLLPMVYLQGGEYDFWFLPLYITFYITIGVGLARVLSWFDQGRALYNAFTLGLTAILTLGPLFWVNLPYLNRRDDHVPEDFGRNLFVHVPRGAVLFAWSDQECMLTYYLQVVEKWRPDVTLVFAPLLTAPWYQKYARERYRELRIPARVAPLPDSNSAGVDEWVAAIVRDNIDHHAFYISKRPSIPPPAPHAWIPAGAQWKLNAREPQEIRLEDWEYSYRNRDPFGRQPERLHAPKHVTDPRTGRPGIQRITYTSEIRMFHLQSWKNLGDWYLARSQFKEAVRAYDSLFKQEPTIALPGLLFSYGKALFAVDRNREALEYIERALTDLGSARAEAAFYIGQIYAQLGDTDRAEQYYALVRRLDPRLWSQNEAALRQSRLLRSEPK
jgi:tetratricopeptide (TPR) repeat protein